MHELGFGTSGVNPWYGTPVNPLAPDLIPGGSSSGPAVAVARGEAEIGLGTDTGGSVRFPAACCGIVGLKTTAGRLSLEGVAALAPSMDSVGPIARDVRTLAIAMSLLEPGFTPNYGNRTGSVGRFRLGCNEVIDDAIDRALSEAGFRVEDVDPELWDVADDAARIQLLAEVHDTLGWLVRDHPEGVGEESRRRFAVAAEIGADDREQSAQKRSEWRAQLEDLFGRYDALALPTMVDDPPNLAQASKSGSIIRTRAVNFAGVPAVALPVLRPSARSPIPPSVQLVGPWGSESDLIVLAQQVESAVTQL
jgi:amidase